jgi:hypothetical protein
MREDTRVGLRPTLTENVKKFINFRKFFNGELFENPFERPQALHTDEQTHGKASSRNFAAFH